MQISDSDLICVLIISLIAVILCILIIVAGVIAIRRRERREQQLFERFLKRLSVDSGISEDEEHEIYPDEWARLYLLNQ
uniref:Vpu protein n=1 Tax=Simian immunodeficiency virus TaxID=11723 RepID=J7FCU0_SIV|nr:vpu protein [Simian immunodeficiency virus]